jgi:hypothetical protein
MVPFIACGWVLFNIACLVIVLSLSCCVRHLLSILTPHMIHITPFKSASTGIILFTCSYSAFSSKLILVGHADKLAALTGVGKSACPSKRLRPRQKSQLVWVQAVFASQKGKSHARSTQLKVPTLRNWDIR